MFCSVNSGAGGTRSPPATPHRLQHLTACFIQNGRQGPEIGQALGYWTLQSTFAKLEYRWKTWPLTLLPVDHLLATEYSPDRSCQFINGILCVDIGDKPYYYILQQLTPDSSITKFSYDLQVNNVIFIQHFSSSFYCSPSPWSGWMGMGRANINENSQT